MAQFDNTGVVATKTPARMLWPRLLKPEPFKKDGKEVGEPKYGAAFAFPADHPDLAELKAKAAAVARAKWPGVEFNAIEWPFKSGAKMVAADGNKLSEEVKAFIADKAVLQARTKKQPLLGKMTAQGPVTLEGLALEKEGRIFYSGAEVILEVNFWPNTGSKGEKYITAYLNAVVSYNVGGRLGGGPPITERFKGYVGHATAENPTKGAVADEIPF